MGRNILVVDDIPTLARCVKMTLEVDGYDVRTATSGFEAMEEVEVRRPDLIVLDIMMPGMNGFEVCRELKRTPKNKKIKIIFLTAMGNPGDAQNAIAAGGDDYVLKPFDPEELLDKVKSILGSV